MARNTVRRYLREPGKVRYGPREPRPCKLDAFKPYLCQRIEQARPDWIPATVLLREIQAAGYGGGISQLKAYLAPLKATTPDPVVRFETEPGRQMQADFTVIRRGRKWTVTLPQTLTTFPRSCTPCNVPPKVPTFKWKTVHAVVESVFTIPWEHR